MRTTRTFATMEVTAAVFAEIKEKLLNAGYGHAIDDHDGVETLDMHGIGLQSAGLAETQHIEVGSIFGHATQRGMVDLKIDGLRAAQLDPKKAQEIGLWLIQCAEAAIADEAHMRLMQDKVGLSSESAAQTLLDLREIRQGTRSAVMPS